MSDLKNQNELIPINTDQGSPLVSARDLHEFLDVGTRFNDWIPRMLEFGFTEGQDFNLLKIERVQNEGGRVVSREILDYQLTISMAKEICMLQRTEKGKLARLYFIKVEEAWNKPDVLIARALKLADQRLAQLKIRNAQLSVENEIMRPKADYFDDLVERNLLTNFRETAKELRIKQTDFISFLLDSKYIYRDQKGKLRPYSEHVDYLFEIKESINQKTGWTGTQTLVTPRGRETFRLLCMGGAK